ncbi:MAG: dihydropteroate synthase [Terriglobia bacterium]
MKLRPEFGITVGSRKIRLGERTLIMGVLNVTPDSFSDGGQFFTPARAIRHAVKMARQGADWIDIGGESTRPGARPVDAAEELRRVIPVIEGIHRRLPGLPISIDTTKAEVAEEALRAGASIVNDVSGLRFDERIAAVASERHAPLILMHLRGHPATMQQKAFARSISRSLRCGLNWSIQRARMLGVPHGQLIIDPGLGFGKTRRQNFEILARLSGLARFGLPIMVGASRKSFIQAVVSGEGLEPHRAGAGARSQKKTRVETSSGGSLISARSRRNSGRIETPAALNSGDAAAAAAAVLAGAHIVRVHDVAAVLPAVRIADAILAASRPSGLL